MTEIIDVFLKVVLPIILAIIACVAPFKDCFVTKKKITEDRDKLSKISYDLYKINKDENLQKLAVEYAYAALTKDNFLNLEQRMALIGSENPTRDIDLFIKCKALLSIETSPFHFVWKKKRYYSTPYRHFMIFVRVVLYCIGVAIFTLPVTFHSFIPAFIITKLSTLPSLTIVSLIIYALISGAFFGYFNLTAAVRLIDSANLIQRHQKP
ncbi:DUF2812 domain-containing protein [Erwinia rhapontici]|uniref:hypothetical protein n=1 Tax=Erwinia rhapontici TaxID=55212 RepID=UPI003D35DD5B